MGRIIAYLTIPYLAWFSIISMSEPVTVKKYEQFTNYVLPCVFNDKTIAMNISLDNSFTELQKQDIFNGVCIALKAFRECKFLRNNWPAQKALGTDLLVRYFPFIHNDDSLDSPNCGYSYPYENKDEIWVTQVAWLKYQCDRPSQIIFHEFLHLSMMPIHNYERTGRYLDPIEAAVRMCLK